MYNLYLNIFNQLGLPEILAQLSWPVIPFIGVAALLVIVVLFLVLLERKVLALLTIRKGPNRVGPYGLFQTIADAIKLLVKEDIMSGETNKILFTLAPIIVFVPTMLIYCLLPYAGNLLAVNIAAGLFLILAVSSVSTVGLVLAGWASNNKYSLLGGMRSAAQAISYEIPLILSAISVAILAGSMNIIDIVEKQSSGIIFWNFTISVLGFIVFFICSIAEVNRIPFDLPEAESELVSGYNTEYSGMKFALFFLAEYAALFIVSVLTVTLFLGGYTSPTGFYISNKLLSIFIPNQIIINLLVGVEQVFWLVFKTYMIIFTTIWIRATLPRLKADQLMSFSWKFLLPLSLINLVIVSVYRYFIPG